jgi:hypothetical protein
MEPRPAVRARRRTLPMTRPEAAVRVVTHAGRALASSVRRRAERHGDAGDVPGWVLVTLMTAGLVSALWWLAKDRLVEVFERAITSVTG